MKKIIIIMIVVIVGAITLSSCEHEAFDSGNAQILITNIIGVNTCKNVKVIKINTDGTAYYAAVDEKYMIRTFVVDRYGTITEE